MCNNAINCVFLYTGDVDVMFNKFNVTSYIPPENPPYYVNSDYDCVVATTSYWKLSKCSDRQRRVVCQSQSGSFIHSFIRDTSSVGYLRDIIMLSKLRYRYTKYELQLSQRNHDVQLLSKCCVVYIFLVTENLSLFQSFPRYILALTNPPAH